jgi:hypothetical protein
MCIFRGIYTIFLGVETVNVDTQCVSTLHTSPLRINASRISLFKKKSKKNQN